MKGTQHGEKDDPVRSVATSDKAKVKQYNDDRKRIQALQRAQSVHQACLTEMVQSHTDERSRHFTWSPGGCPVASHRTVPVVSREAALATIGCLPHSPSSLGSYNRYRYVSKWQQQSDV